MRADRAHAVRGAAALAAAMGIGRFAYTPILPLMTAQAAVTPQLAGNLATATMSDTSPVRWRAPHQAG